MALRCKVCHDPRVAEIDGRIAEGIGTAIIVEELSGGRFTRGMLDQHRKAGHAARSLTRQVLQVAQSGVLAPIAQFAISEKGFRLGEIQRLYDRVLAEINSQPVGALNHRMVAVAVELLENASKEMGTWRPDGGKAAEATNKLAQSIVIHAAVEARKQLPTLDSSQSRERDDAIDVAPDGSE